MINLMLLKFYKVDISFKLFIFTNKIDFEKKKKKINYAFSVSFCEESWCGRAHPVIVFQNYFDPYLPFTYKIKLVKAQVLKG